MANTRFGIICTYRTGSTLLKDAFGKNCVNEIFGHDYYEKLNPGMYQKRNKEPLNFLNYHLDLSGEEVMGAKIMIEQLSKQALDRILKSPKHKKILLVRENLTDMAVSYIFMCISKQTILFDKELYEEGISKIPYAHALMGTKRNKPNMFKIDIPKLIERCENTYKRMIDCEKTLNQYGNYIKITYNELSDDSGSINLDTVNKCREFVNLPIYTEYKSPLKKMANESVYRECIANYDEINEKLGPKYGVLFSKKTPSIWRGK